MEGTCFGLSYHVQMNQLSETRLMTDDEMTLLT